MKIKITMIIIFVLMSNLLFAIEGKTKIEIDMGIFNKIYKGEMKSKIYKTVRHKTELFKGNYTTSDYYLVEYGHGTGRCPNEEQVFISKTEYEKKPEKYQDKYGRIRKDFYLCDLPAGTKFELVEIKIHAGELYKCHYYVKLLDMPEYKDILVDAFFMSPMNEGIFGPWGKEWKFINERKEKIYPEKIPLLRRSYAIELTEEEYKEYYRSQGIEYVVEKKKGFFEKIFG